MAYYIVDKQQKNMYYGNVLISLLHDYENSEAWMRKCWEIVLLHCQKAVAIVYGARLNSMKNE